MNHFRLLAESLEVLARHYLHCYFSERVGVLRKAMNLDVSCTVCFTIAFMEKEKFKCKAPFMSKAFQRNIFVYKWIEKQYKIHIDNTF